MIGRQEIVSLTLVSMFALSAMPTSLKYNSKGHIAKNKSVVGGVKVLNTKLVGLPSYETRDLKSYLQPRLTSPNDNNNNNMNLVDQIADAIYIAEGGEKTKFPYGVKSVKCVKSSPRQVCINTIFHYWTNFRISGNEDSMISTAFIRYASNRYCPKSTDPIGNANWYKNVCALLSLKP